MPRGGWQPKKGKGAPTSPPKPTPNPQRGEVPIEIAGEVHYASINYDKAARLIELFSEGQEATTCNFGNGALQAWLAGDVDKISAALSILTGLSIEDIYQASPAWERSFEVITAAYNLFYFGVADPPETKEEAQPESPLENAHRPSLMQSLWSWLGRTPSQPASSQANSGPPPSMKSGSTSRQEAN